ncbi:MAG: sensor histidine kinase [candidate division NC10 bacterium]|nr:sensor histidine kinase [candidate division NC10 bacterium]
MGHLAALLGRSLAQRALGPTEIVLGSLRVLVILGSAAWLALAPLPIPDRRPLVYLLLAFTGYSSFLLALLLRRPRWVARIDLTILVADLATAFALVFLTGGMQSELFVAFYLLTAIHAYCFSLVRGLAVAGTSAFLCYLSGWPGLSLVQWPHCVLRLAFLFLMAVALGLLAQRERRDRRALAALNEECQAEHRELESAHAILQEKERRLNLFLGNVIRAQEEERRRVGRDLHDGMGQNLSALMLALDAPEKTILSGGPAALDHLARLKDIGANLLQEIRDIIADLRPTILDDLGLVHAVCWYGERRLQENRVAFSVEADGLTGRLPTHVETALFRVIQEAVSNIARHAQARTARVLFRCQGSTVEVVVEDDGKGFDTADKGPEARGRIAFGLLGMRERLALLRGSFEIDSQVGSGTRVRAVVPLKEREVGDG